MLLASESKPGLVVASLASDVSSTMTHCTFKTLQVLAFLIPITIPDVYISI